MVNSTTNSSSSVPSVPVDKSLWGQIEEFYSDKNNMAMYLVLPLIVIVYGGCSLIFCIHKCMQYCKKSKKKRDREALLQESRRKSIVTRSEHRPRSIASIHPEITQSTEPKRTPTPLPWQVPDDSETEQNKATERSTHSHKVSRAHTGKTPPPPYKEVDDIIVLSGPQNPGYPSHHYSKKQDYSPLELTKQLLRLGDDDKEVRRGRRKRLVFTTD
jgi:hypothetical protein